MTGPNVPRPPFPDEPMRPPFPDEVPVHDPDIVPNPDPDLDPSIDEPIEQPERPIMMPPPSQPRTTG